MNTPSVANVPSRRRSAAIATAALCAALLSACRPAATPTPPPTATAPPSATPMPSRTRSATRRPTAMPTPTATGTATATPVPPLLDAPLPVVGRLGGGGEGMAMAVDETWAYVIEGRRIIVYDVAEPARPRIVGSAYLPPSAEPNWGWETIAIGPMVARDGWVMLVDDEGGVHVIDVRQPERVPTRSYWPNVVEAGDSDWRTAAYRAGDRVVVARGASMFTLDWRPPAAPVVQSHVVLPCPIYRMASNDRYAVATVWSCPGAWSQAVKRATEQVWVIDTTTPDGLAVVGSVTVPESTGRVQAVSVTTAYFLGSAERPGGLPLALVQWFRLDDVRTGGHASEAYVAAARTADAADATPSTPLHWLELDDPMPPPLESLRGCCSDATRTPDPNATPDPAFAADPDWPTEVNNPSADRHDGVLVGDRWIVQSSYSIPFTYGDDPVFLETWQLPSDGPPRRLGRRLQVERESGLVAAAGNTVLVASSGARLTTYDVTTGDEAQPIGSVDDIDTVTSVAPLSGRPGWLVTNGAVVDARDPAHPRVVAAAAGGVVAGGLTLQAADRSHYDRRRGLRITSLTAPSSPWPIPLDDDDVAYWVAASSRVAVVGRSCLCVQDQLQPTDSLALVDLTDPQQPRWAATISPAIVLTPYPTPNPSRTAVPAPEPDPCAWPSSDGYYADWTAGVHMGESFAALAIGRLIQVYDVADPDHPKHAARLDLGGQAGALVSVDDHRVVVRLGLEDGYHAIDVGGDIVLIELSAEGQPNVAGRWSFPTGRPGTMAVAGTTLLLADDRGLAVVDVVDWAAPSPVVRRRWAVPFDVQAMAVDGDSVYLATGDDGLVIASLSALRGE